MGSYLCTMHRWQCGCGGDGGGGDKSSPKSSSPVSPLHNHQLGGPNNDDTSDDEQHNRVAHNCSEHNSSSCKNCNCNNKEVKKNKRDIIINNRNNNSQAAHTTSVNQKQHSSTKTSSSIKKKSKQQPYQTMSIVLKPTVKHTASVIFLHGLGDTGAGWSMGFAEIKLPHIKYIFPTAPIMPVSLNGGMEMTSWFDIKSLKPDAAQDETGIKKSSQILLDLVKNEVDSGIPTEKIFIGGFSQGGATALYTALTSQHRFAGVIALSTWLPLHKQFPASLVTKDFTLPILQCHGDSDFMVPLPMAQISVEMLKAIGFKNLEFKIYPGLQHSSDEKEMEDVAKFIAKIAPN